MDFLISKIKFADIFQVDEVHLAKEEDKGEILRQLHANFALLQNQSRSATVFFEIGGEILFVTLKLCRSY